MNHNDQSPTAPHQKASVPGDVAEMARINGFKVEHYYNAPQNEHVRDLVASRPLFAEIERLAARLDSREQ